MRRLVYILLLSIPLAAYSQSDSTTLSKLDIDLVTIQASKTTTADSSLVVTTATPSLSQLLEKQSNIYIKSYGLGSLATLSLWGGNASQTLIEWEGIPISNPMLGLTDLSLIPLTGSTQVGLRKGGLSAEHGSGAMTGLVSISQKDLRQEDQLELGLTVGQGSFGRYNADLALAQNFERFSYTLNGFFLQANNDFSYNTKLATITQSNADLSYAGLSGTATYSTGSRCNIGLNIWFQDSEKGIPPTSVQTTSVARQEDLQHRVRLFWNHTDDNYSLHSHIALVEEQNNYADSLNLEFARNRFQKKIHQLDFKSSRGSTQFLVRSNLEITDGYSDSYDDDHQRLSSYALYAAIEQQHNKFRLKGSLRKEWRSIVSPPLLPTLSLSYQKGQFSSRIKLSKEYRAPTLNELFWVPGGNRNLQPEEGWNQELSLELRNLLQTGLGISGTFFHRKIENWILWSPAADPNFWSPFNLGAVRSYGVDIEGQKSFVLGGWSSDWTVGYNYNRSENLTRIRIPAINEGDQLIYTPRSKAYVNSSSQYKNCALQLTANYTSEAIGINEDIPGYWLLATRLAYTYKKNKLTNQFSINIENVTNQTYRVIERRPMPGRYYTISWSIQFHAPKQDNKKF